MLAEHPQLAAAMGALLTRARGLLRGPLPPDGPQLFSKPSAPGQLALELPQVARYHQGVWVPFGWVREEAAHLLAGQLVFRDVRKWEGCGVQGCGGVPGWG